MIKTLKTTASRNEILQDTLEEAEIRLYELTHFPGYEDSDEFLEITNEIKNIKDELDLED